MDITNSLLREGITITTALEFVKSAIKDQINNTDKIDKLDNIILQIQALKTIETVCQAQKEAIIKEMINPAKKTTDTKGKYGSVNWLANLIDRKPDTIYKYLKEGDTLPYIKKGRKILFDKKEIYEWIEGDKIKTSSQIKEDVLRELSELRN